jgi:putative ABC transport system permease protein
VLRVAIKMLIGDRAKYAGLVFGITFTSFLVTFAASYFTGFMTRGFALVSENQTVDVWVMDPAVRSVEKTANMAASALDRVRSIEGVRSAVPMALGTAEVRFPNGAFQSFQVIGVDDSALAGVPPLKDGVSAAVLRTPDSVIADPGGTSGKLQTPLFPADQWPGVSTYRRVRSLLAMSCWSMTAMLRSLVGRRHYRDIRRDHCCIRHIPTPLAFCCLNGAG